MLPQWIMVGCNLKGCMDARFGTPHATGKRPFETIDSQSTKGNGWTVPGDDEDVNLMSLEEN